MAEVIICCPKCEWKPDGGEYWQCSCGHVWNTFETAARCPACKKQWQDTWCPDVIGGCGLPSPHLDWYRNLDAWLREELEKIMEGVPLEVTIPNRPV